MKPRPSKHSVVLRGHRTSVNLEPPFWDVLQEAARTRELTVAQLISLVDEARSYNNLSSALRLYALDFCRKRATRVGASMAAR